MAPQRTAGACRSVKFFYIGLRVPSRCTASLWVTSLGTRIQCGGTLSLLPSGTDSLVVCSDTVYHAVRSGPTDCKSACATAATELLRPFTASSASLDMRPHGDAVPMENPFSQDGASAADGGCVLHELQRAVGRHYTRGTAHSADTPWGTAKGRRQFRRIPANAKVTRRKTTLRWNTRGEMMTPIEKRKG